MKRLIVILAMGVTAAAFCRTARADKCWKEVEPLWLDGKAKYNVGEFDEASAIWKIAYEKCHDPKLLFNMGQAARQANRPEDALGFYAAYLRESPNIDPATRKLVEERMKELDDLIKRKKASAEKPPDGVQEASDDTITPAAAVRSEARSPVEPEPTSPHNEWYKDKVAWWITASGVVMLGVGAGLLLHADALRDDAGAAYYEQAHIDLHASGDDFALAGGIVTAVGGAITIVGIVKLVTHEDEPRARSVRVACGAGWCSVSGSF